jgi:protein-arginine deiminase
MRTGGRVVFTQLRGPDVAGVQVTPNHDSDMDTLDSFGNTETIPPFAYNGKSYPLGRLYRGATATFYPDTGMRTLLESQLVQPPVYVDTSFLLVAHVDETVTFLKAGTPRGWTVAVADPVLAKTILEQEEAAGRGNAVVFPGMYTQGDWGWTSAEVTVSELLNDTAVMDASAEAAVGIADQIAVLKAETGITDAEILHFPVLFEKVSGYGVAYTRGPSTASRSATPTSARPTRTGPSSTARTA